MQSIDLARSLFGGMRISLIGAALLVGTMLLAVNGTAQQARNWQQPGSTPESPGMGEHVGTPTSLHELVQEVEQKNPRIAGEFRRRRSSGRFNRGRAPTTVPRRFRLR